LHFEEGQWGLWPGLGIEPGDEVREHNIEGMGFHLAEDELGEAGPEAAPPA
jgi:hypothetical protein